MTLCFVCFCLYFSLVWTVSSNFLIHKENDNNLNCLLNTFVYKQLNLFIYGTNIKSATVVIYNGSLSL